MCWINVINVILFCFYISILLLYLNYLQYIAIKKEITAVNKVFQRYAHSQRNENGPKNPDDPRNAMMIKIMFGLLFGYVMLYVLSLLLPNASNPEVSIHY